MTLTLLFDGHSHNTGMYEPAPDDYDRFKGGLLK